MADESTVREVDGPLTLRFGREELVISRRYEVASIVNDFFVALWFLVGSVMFLSPHWTVAGTWLFILGSFQLLLRPAIRLAHRVHVKRVPSERVGW